MPLFNVLSVPDLIHTIDNNSVKTIIPVYCASPVKRKQREISILLSRSGIYKEWEVHVSLLVNQISMAEQRPQYMFKVYLYHCY